MTFLRQVFQYGNLLSIYLFIFVIIFFLFNVSPVLLWWTFILGSWWGLWRRLVFKVAPYCFTLLGIFLLDGFQRDIILFTNNEL